MFRCFPMPMHIPMAIAKTRRIRTSCNTSQRDSDWERGALGESQTNVLYEEVNALGSL